MTYLVIENFNGGLDTRRLEQAAPAGSLQVLSNAQINRGGEIEKSKKFVIKYSLPPDTFGLEALNGELYAFGSVTSPTMPSGVLYQQLTVPSLAVMTGIVSSEIFSGGIYIVASFNDGKKYHFYNGTIIDDWENGIIVSSMASLSDMATALAALIDADPDVTATAVGAVITVEANVVNVPFTITGTAENKDGGVDDQTITIVETVAPSGAAKQKNTVTLAGTFEVGDKFTVIVNDNYYGSNWTTNRDVNQVFTHKNKVYAIADSDLIFSGVAEPTKWMPQDIGSGVIDMTSQAANNEELTGLGSYQGSLAVFSRNTIQIWAMDADATSNAQLQILDNIGTRSPKSIISFGDSDVFFLSDSGVRSLRSRDSSNSAGVNDIGTPIDNILIEAMRDLTSEQISGAVSAIEPKDGRYIVTLNDKTYVFTYFPSSKISAWSTWDNGLIVTDYTVTNGQLWARSGNDIYLYGGDNGTEYTDNEVTIELPYLDARSIASWKMWTGIDIIADGEWDVYVNTNPNQPTTWVKTATIYKHSIGQLKLSMQQRSPVIKFKFVNNTSGSATISKIIVHYKASAYSK